MKFLETLINGFSIGGIYAMIALGYTMVYGIAKMLNFAHGDIIMVGALEKESIFKIIDLELNSFYKRIHELGFELEITPAAKEFLAEKGYDKQYGARPLKRAIQSHIEDALAEILLRGEAIVGDTILVDVDDEKIITSIKK